MSQPPQTLSAPDHPPRTTAPSARSTVRRHPERARFDAPLIHAIIDAAWHCHVAFVAHPDVLCIPMACWRRDERLYVHGANGSRMMKHLAAGHPACVSITLMDGLVLARSAFHHSMNYRSVMIHGHFEPVDAADKPAVLQALIDRIAPQRSTEVRPSNPKELAATTVLSMSLHEAVAKVREGGPKDATGDLQRPTWAGVIPCQTVYLTPVPDSDNTQPLPAYLQDLHPEARRAGPHDGGGA